MNVRTILLDSILSSLEEDQQQSVERDIIDEIILNIQSLKRLIEHSKENLKS